MNNKRRKELKGIIDRLSNLQEEYEGIYNDLDSIINDEQEAFDNLPESLQYGERGQNMEDIISKLEDIRDNIETAKDDISENYIPTIEEVIE